MLKIIITALLLATTAHAAKTVEDTTACVTEAYYDEMMQYAARKDIRGYAHMVQTNKCIILRGGIEASIISQTFTMTVARLYSSNGKSAVLYMPREGLR